MNAISVSDKVWFEEDILGATLNFYSDCKPGGVLFRVGISYRSLQECNKALSAHICSWTIADGSLSFWGDQEEIALAFVSLGTQPVQSSIRFRGQALQMLRHAIGSLAYRQILATN